MALISKNKIVEKEFKVVLKLLKNEKYSIQYECLLVRHERMTRPVEYLTQYVSMGSNIGCGIIFVGSKEAGRVRFDRGLGV